MNPLEKNVASLETCKKLNWKGETAFVWEISGFDEKEDFYKLVLFENSKKTPEFLKHQIKAPTLIEMLRVLPCALNKDKKRYDFVLLKGTEKYLAKYQHGYFLNSRQDYVYTDLLVGFTHKSPVEALAKLYKWCEEEGYL